MFLLKNQLHHKTFLLFENGEQVFAFERSQMSGNPV